MANEIKFYLSGGSSNTNPFLSNGGTISNTEIVNGLLNNLWPDVSESDAFNGITDHKVIFVKNVSGGALTAVKAYFGELDNFIGMAILSSTTPNTSVAALATPTEAVTDYFVIWDNAGESPVAQITLNNTVKRVVLLINYATHPVYNQYPDKIDLMLAKTGSPTGTATVKVWAMASGVAPSATDNTVIRTLGTLDVSTLTTSFTKKTFSTVTDVVTNPLPSVGWRIGIEYTAGTSTNVVLVGQSAQPNTGIKFSGISQNWDGSKWNDFANNMPSMAVYTNTGACFQSGNPPPPGGGTPPPGDCGSSAPAQGTIPVAGGGGGMTANGYPITAAADNGNDGNVAANAIDHNLATRWSQNSTTAQLTLDMGVSHPVDRVKIAWYKGNERQAKFNLAYSTNGSSFTDIVPPTTIPVPQPPGGGPPPSPPPGGIGTPPPADLQTDRLNLSFTSSGYTSEYHIFAAGLDWTKPVGLLLYTDGSAEFGLHHPTDTYLMAGTNGMIAVAKRNNMVLLTPFSPNKACADGDGSCWYMGDPPGYMKWAEALVKQVESQFRIDKRRVAVGGYSSGAQFCTEYWIPSGAAQRTMDQGVIVAISFGGRPQMTEVVYDPAFKTNVHLHWDTGVNDPSWLEDDPTEGPIPGGFNGKAGFDYYSAHGFQTSFVLIAGTDHDRDGEFGGIMDAQINSHLMASTSEAISTNYISSGTSLALQEFSILQPGQSSPANAITARYIRYLGLGNTQNNWNSVTEFEIWGNDVGNPNPSPPPPGGGNFSKPSSYDTGIALPNLNNNDFVAIHLERLIPPRSNHVELENYSIVISNEPHPAPPSDEPVPGLPGGGGGGPGSDPNLPPIGEIPLPTPPGVFDPGTIPPPEPIPPPPPDTNPPPPDGGPGGGPCPGPPDTPPPGGGGGGGTTPDGITLVTLPSGYSYSNQYTNFHENFQSNGSFRLDVGVQPQLNELNLTFYLNLSSGSDEISSKLSGGTHTDSKAKNGRCYDIGLNQDGKRVRIRKENPHPDYHDGPSHSINLGSLNAKWVGVQSLKWNEGSNCHLQCWVDTSGSTTPTNKWTKILDDIDTGGWFESPYLTCYASNDSQTTIRVDSMSTSKFHYKFLCATRIVHS